MIFVWFGVAALVSTGIVCWGYHELVKGVEHL